jgi:diguanylate cyclase (GGDEF)-like protein/PAS domain S-box-containing protein
MNIIELQIFELIQFILYAVCTGVVVLLWLQYRRSFPGLGQWVAGFAMLTSSIVLIMLGGIVPLWVSTLIGGNMLVLGGVILLFRGLEAFTGQRSNPFINAVVWIASAALQSYFIFVQPNLAAQNINITVALLFISAQIAWLMLHRVGSETRSMTQFVGYLFVVLGLVSAVRIMINLDILLGNGDFELFASLDALLNLVYQICFFATTYGLFFLINQRLFEELRTQQTVLERSKAHNQKLAELAPDAIFIYSDGVINFVNSAAVTLLGAANADEIIGKNVHEIMHPDYRPSAGQSIAGKLARERTTPLFAEKLISFDGSIVDVEFMTSQIEYQGQAALRTIVRENTDRKRAERVLRLRLELFEFSVDNSLEMLMQRALDEIGRITNSPIGFYHFVAADQKTLSLQAWTTRTLQEFCQAEVPDMNNYLDDTGVWADCIRQRKAIILNEYDTLTRRKELPMGHAKIKRLLVAPTMRDDQIVSILGVGNKPSDYDEKDIDLVAYVSDVIWTIIERKRAELQLQNYQYQLESQNLELRKLSLAIEQSGNTVMITDSSGIIRYANPRFEETSGYRLNEVIGKNPRILKSGYQKAEFYQDLWQTITSGQIWRGELHNRRKDGSLYWESTTIAPVQNTTGQVTDFIAIKEDITDRKRLETELVRLATTDPLTGTLNRRQMTNLANQELERAQRYGHPTSVILLDIDEFKEINDQYGHAAGDLALQYTAQTLQDNLRTIDFLGRYGGDEFVILLPETGQSEAVQVAERLRATLDGRKVMCGDQDLQLSISLGLTHVMGGSNEQASDFDMLTQLADQALYQAKEAGRNCVSVYTKGYEPANSSDDTRNSERTTSR